MWPNKRLEQLKVIRTSQSTWTCRATRFGTVWNYCQVFPTDTSTWHIPYLKKMKRRWLETIPVDGKFHHRCPLWAVDFQSCLGLYTCGSPSVVWPMKPMTSNDVIWQKRWCFDQQPIFRWHMAPCVDSGSPESPCARKLHKTAEIYGAPDAVGHTLRRGHTSHVQTRTWVNYTKTINNLGFSLLGITLGTPWATPGRHVNCFQGSSHTFFPASHATMLSPSGCHVHCLVSSERRRDGLFGYGMVWLKMGHCHWGGES